MNEIDLADSNSIIFFGSKAQQELTSISDNMLEGVRNKDVGSAGTALNQMVTVLRGFEIENFDPNARPGFFARLWRKLFGGITPVAKFIQQYEGVRKQIDVVTDDLEGTRPSCCVTSPRSIAYTRPISTTSTTSSCISSPVSRN